MIYKALVTDWIKILFVLATLVITLLCCTVNIYINLHIYIGIDNKGVDCLSNMIFCSFLFLPTEILRMTEPFPFRLNR